MMELYDLYLPSLTFPLQGGRNLFGSNELSGINFSSRTLHPACIRAALPVGRGWPGPRAQFCGPLAGECTIHDATVLFAVAPQAVVRSVVAISADGGEFLSRERAR